MTKREFIENQLSKLKSDEIIFNLNIPEYIRKNLKMEEIKKGVPIDTYEDGSFSLFVELVKGKGVAILFTITMYEELFCKTYIVPYAHENRQKISERIKEIVNDYE